ncbi:MAG: hypothetical protein RL684_2473 [Pseudomonadota bacterium]|jgi:hypothetical protein
MTEQTETATATMDVHSPEQTDSPELQAALQLRDKLLTTERWVTSETLARRAGVDVDPDTYAAERRRKGTLLGVRYQDGYLHPSRQFLPRSADTLPRFNELLSVLLPYMDDQWLVLFWFFQATGRLGGRSPAEAFPDDPDKVIAAARADFEGDPDI